MSNKLEQVLIIEPANELVFVGPFTSAVSSMMSLRNPSDQKVCFKIKTTAPKRYCVKPNSGVIDPNQQVQVVVSLQPFDFDPNDKTRHKFMVQSMFAPDGEINQDTLWKDTSGNQLMDSKLRCVFTLPETSQPVPTLSGGDENNDFIPTKPDVYSSTKSANLSSSPKANIEGPELKKSIDEIKKLQEEISQLRQENIQLREETIRQKRLAASAQQQQHRPEVSSSMSEVVSVNATSPDQNALSLAYIYAALAILIVGIIMGKWFV